jgi:glucose/arabinose dehydrogenase
MKFFISIIFFLLTFNLNASEYKLEKVISGLNKPWGMSFINDDELFLTQKSGEILKINLTTKEVKNFSHNLKVVQPHWQAGMLDIIYKDEEVFVSYTEDRGNDKTSTSIARGIIKDESFSEIENIFQSDSSWNNIHWGSRLMFKGDLLYASIGERGHGSVAQDPTSYFGKMIRINKDGSAPKDNPYAENKGWLPEIYQIGLRNPQGIILNPQDDEIYITNHGPRGGDFFGKVEAGTNYGWADVAWGGIDYDGSIIGDGSAWKEGLLKPIYTWIPSIAVSDMTFYVGDLFPDLKNKLLITSLKAQKLISLEFDGKKARNETILFEKIGRVRDVEANSVGEIFVIIDNDNSGIWKLVSD